MTLGAGARIGPYVIEAAVEAGGMAEVYRASDVRLDRRVAVKILPPAPAADATRRARFAREARALSGLAHPHICQIHDVGEHDGRPFLVMEYLEGETLAQRLARGPVPVSEAIRHAIDMADALQYAHRHGIVHRDLKPANVLLSPAGIKLLDFGLARLDVPFRIAGAPQESPRAITESLTEDGAIVGTVQYMAPEQLEGMEVDGRSDVFALGAVLYEMTTGSRAFPGDSRAGVIAAVLERTPRPMTAVLDSAATAIPPLLDQIVARCLAKRPDDRWQSASDLKEALTWLASGTTTTAMGFTAGGASGRRGWRQGAIRWAAAGILLAVALAAAATSAILRRSSAPIDIWFEVRPPEGSTLNPSSAFLTVSPDGNHLAFVASTRTGGSALWLRARDSVAPRLLTETEDAFQPFWSADSRFIAFGTPDGLRTLDISTSVVRSLAETVILAGTWNHEGDIVIALGPTEHRYGHKGLYRLSSAGGTPSALTTLDSARSETSHAWPQFLPDGRRFLYLARSSDPAHDGTVMVGSLDSARSQALFTSDSHAVYAAGHLLFMRGNRLVAQSFDVATLRPQGEPVIIAADVERNAVSRRGAFSVSDGGVLAYRAVGQTQMVWLDRQGGWLGAVGGPGHYSNPALSPDEQLLVVERTDGRTGQPDVWIFDARTGLGSRFTHAGGERPLWWPQGDRIVYRAPIPSARGTAASQAFVSRVTRGGLAEETLLAGVGPFDSPVAWSPDGEALIYTNFDSRVSPRLWMLPLSGERTTAPLAHTPLAEVHGQVSPDGRWLAYVSNETGRYEVYVRPFPSGEGRIPISPAGGLEPVWRRDGRELFYLAADRSLMSVRVSPSHGFDGAARAKLFGTQLSTSMNVGYTRNQYVASGDGQRFLLVHPSGTPPAITVVVNWTARLRERR